MIARGMNVQKDFENCCVEYMDLWGQKAIQCAKKNEIQGYLPPTPTNQLIPTQ